MTLRSRITAGIAATTAAALLLTACSGADQAATGTADKAGETAASASVEAAAVTVTDNHGEVEIAQPIERAAVLDNRAFEILNNWGVDIVAAPLDIVPATLKDKINESTVEANIGSHREPDLEALVAADADVVFTGQRFVKHYEGIAKLIGDETPLIDFEPRDGEDFSAELIRHTEAMGTVFGHEDDAKKLVDDYNAAIERVKAAYDPSKKVMAVNTSGGEIGYIAPGKGRFFGPIFDLVGMTPALEIPAGTDDHEGDDVSVEAIAAANPDIILVLDRDGAVGAKDGVLHGQKLIEDNAALKNVTAVKDGAVIVAPEDTYTNENIITFTEVLNQMADAFEAAK